MILLPVRGRDVWLESCSSENGIEPPLWENIRPAEMLAVLLEVGKPVKYGSFAPPVMSSVDEEEGAAARAPKRELTG